MKTPLRWLADYVELPQSVDDLVYRLTMSGIEVEERHPVGRELGECDRGTRRRA